MRDTDGGAETQDLARPEPPLEQGAQVLGGRRQGTLRAPVYQVHSAVLLHMSLENNGLLLCIQVVVPGNETPIPVEQVRVIDSEACDGPAREKAVLLHAGQLPRLRRRNFEPNP